MTESIMFAALGFLAASLLALVMIPAVNSRAERLARRRLEALFPMSLTELNAEKDHLRAEFAVLQRRLERKAEEALASKRVDMEELGRRAVRIEALETELSQRDGRLGELQAELVDMQRRLASTTDELDTSQRALADAREALGALETLHRRLLEELTQTRAKLDSTEAGLADTKTELDETRERLRIEETARREFETRHNEALGDLDAKRITISDLETRLATQTARANEFERLAAERRQEVGAERQRLADVAHLLVAEQEHVIALQKQLAIIQAEREGAPAPPAGIARAPSHQPDRTAELEHALKAAQDERTKLAGDLEAARREAAASGEVVRAENAELRRRLDEVADQILRAAEAKPEKKARARASGA